MLINNVCFILKSSLYSGQSYRFGDADRQEHVSNRRIRTTEKIKFKSIINKQMLERLRVNIPKSKIYSSNNPRHVTKHHAPAAIHRWPKKLRFRIRYFHDDELIHIKIQMCNSKLVDYVLNNSQTVLHAILVPIWACF